jgi:tetratricopeptide (TPR) repeat protein
VVGAIAPNLEQAETERALRKATENPDAYDCFLRATAHHYLFTRDSLLEARRLFHRVTELDPTYASAYGFGTWCITMSLTNGWLNDPEREVAEGVRLARRAVSIGMDDPVALLLGGGGLGDLAGETESGIVYVDRAIVLNPNLALAWAVSGWLRMYLGEHTDAIVRLERAMRLSPLDLHAYRLQTAMAWTHLFAGRYDEAASWARKAALEKPEWAVPPRIEAIAWASSGRVEEAQEALARMHAIDPDLRLSHLATQRGVAARLRRAEDRTLMMEGLRRAGLPE